jgi:hypothetical protein
MQKGYSEAECRTTSGDKEEVKYPRTIGWRTFLTKEEYDEAIHDFLNSL